MPQQINLYSPILLTPKRYFSALAMVQSGLALLLGMAGFAIWVEMSTERIRHDSAAATATYQGDKQRLSAELARRPAAKDTSALDQELVQARKQLGERRQLLEELAPTSVPAGSGRAAVLRAVAQTVPEVVWLTELKMDEGRLEIAGMTLAPEALRPWLDRLAEQPALTGQALRAVKVERSDSVPTGVEAWSFRVVSSRHAGGSGDPP